MTALKDKVALITGSASGIGAACALRFAHRSAFARSSVRAPCARPSYFANVVFARARPHMRAMHFQLTEDLTLIRDMAANFAASELAPHAEHWDREKYLDREVFEKLWYRPRRGMEEKILEQDPGPCWNSKSSC